MTELFLADGPTRYLGGSIETFALPYGAFIVIATVLYFIFKRPHSVPRMRYLTSAHQVSTGTREPGQGGMVRLRGPMPASAVVAESETGVPGLQPPNASETLQGPDILPETDFVHPAGEAAAEQAAANEAALDEAAAHDPAAHDPAAHDPAAHETAADGTAANEAEGTSDAGA